MRCGARAVALRSSPETPRLVLRRLSVVTPQFVSHSPIPRQAQIDYATDESGRRLQGNSDKARPDFSYNVELPGGLIYEVINAPPGWQKKLASGTSRITVPRGAVVTADGYLDFKGKSAVSLGDGGGNFDFNNNLFEGDRNLESDAEEIARTPEQQANLDEIHRQLKTGTKTVLAVRIVAKRNNDVKRYGSSAANLEKYVFDTETVSMREQYKSCSYDQLILNKAANRGMSSNPGDETTSIVNGKAKR